MPTMPPETLEALRGSIKKWEGIVRGDEVDQGSSNCPLCKLFLDDDDEPACCGCPVAERVDRIGCEGTPYRAWMNATVLYGKEDAEWFRKAETDEHKAAAQAEVDFLQSLLPGEEKA